MISREKLQFIMMVMKNTNSIKATAKAVGIMVPINWTAKIRK